MTMILRTARRATCAGERASRTDAAAFLAGAPAAWERDLSTFFAERTSPPGRRLRTLLRDPAGAAGALRGVLRLPHLDVRLGDGPEARSVRRHLARTAGFGRLPVLRDVVDVLPMPAEPGEYTRGRARQTLRQRIRAAEHQGTTWRRVAGPGELAALLALAAEQERTHPIARYRLDHPDNTDLDGYRHVLVATAPDGTPLLLVAVAVDGPFAMLRYFGTLGHGQAQSDARFLMAGVLVEYLVPMGVRYLFNSRTPFTVPAGLRHFQRMLGWRLCRVKIRGGRRAA